MKRAFVWIDIIRLVFALLVVCIHVPCALKPFFSWLLPIAVPGFFAISGFLMWNKPVESYNRAMRKVGIATLVTFVLYLPIYILLFQDHDWRAFGTWVNMLVFNEPFESEHLWYLLAYLYVLVLFRCLDKQLRASLHPVPLLVVALLLIGGNVVLRDAGLEDYWWRNWLLTGVPYFCFGHVLRSIYEARNLHFLEADAQKHPWLASIGQWGARYTLDIYILHPLVFVLCGYTLCQFFLFRAAMWWMGPVVIFLITWGVSIIRHRFIYWSYGSKT